MKKTFNYICTLAALLMAGAAFTACSSDDSIVEEQPVVNPSEPVYTLTINATNGDATTRALNLDGTKLKASWAESDVVTVTKGTTAIGSLGVKAGSISADGLSATFTGSLTGDVAVNDVLVLSYHPITSVSAFQSQDGTLKGANGAEEYDMATATVTVASVNAEKKISTTADASFSTKTAMIKLTLTDGTNALNANSLNVKATITLPSPYPAITEDVLTFTIDDGATGAYKTNGDGILYYALPSANTVAKQLATKYSGYGINETTALGLLTTATITFTATVGGKDYIVNKPGYQFVAGKYYKATLTMTEVPPSLNLTSPAVGQVIGSDGKNYDYASLPTGVTAVAKICYFNGTNGLALALADEASKMDWSTAQTTCAAHTAPFTGGTWKLATYNEWNYMISAAGSYTALRDGFSSVGGDNLQSEVGYWSSTEAGSTTAYYFSFKNSDYFTGLKTYAKWVRACLAF